MNEPSTLSVAWRRTGRVIAACSALAIGVATLTPSAQRITSGPWCFFCGSLGTVDVLLNIILYVPLGLGLVMAGVRPSRVLAIAAAYSLSVELLQLSVVSGRDSSISDFAMNSLGSVVGAVLGRNLSQLANPSQQLALRLSAAWLVIWVSFQGMAAAAAMPSPTSPPYHGHLGRALSGLPPYPGQIVSATVGGERIPNTWFEGTRVHDALTNREGAPMEVIVIPNGRPDWLASIARVVDARGSENLMMAQDGADVVFGVRARAARMKVRHYRVRVSGVFAPAGGDTLRVLGLGTGRRLSLQASTDTHAHKVVAALTPGHAWRILTPFQSYIAGAWHEAVLGALWLFAAIVPAAYWAGRAATPGEGRQGRWSAVPLAVPAVGIALVFLAIPIVLQTHFATFLEWIGAAAGIAVGFTLAALLHQGRELRAGNATSTRGQQELHDA